MSQRTTFVDDRDGSSLEVAVNADGLVRVHARPQPGDPALVMVDLDHDDAVAFAKAVLTSAKEAA